MYHQRAHGSSFEESINIGKGSINVEIGMLQQRVSQTYRSYMLDCQAKAK